MPSGSVFSKHFENVKAARWKSEKKKEQGTQKIIGKNLFENLHVNIFQ